MTALRLAMPIVSLALSFGPACVEALADDAARADEMQVTLTGTVRGPDGSPAPGAIVESNGETSEPTIVTRTDGAGRFRISGVFGNGAPLHARSADGTLQEVRIIPAGAVRSASAAPIALTLAPAVVHEVVVQAEGRAVEGAHVVASGFGFEVLGVTGADGAARLRLPARERLQGLVAWHPRLGVQGTSDLEERPPQDRTTLALMPPAPLRFRVVDREDHPVGGVEFAVHVSTEGSGWAVVGKIEAAHVRTGADGTAAIPWAPREVLRYVDVRPVGPDWKKDATDLERIGDRIVTVQARRMVPVKGRLVMPAGASAEGLLITGFGFGPGNTGDRPYARARADGSFTFRAASDHGYGLGIIDLEWAAAPWSGLILSKPTEKTADIAMSVDRATPVTIRVTRGPRRAPVDRAYVDAGSKVDVKWLDSGGKERSGRAGIGSWSRTDDDGVARVGAARGRYEVRLASGTWDEKRTITVSSDRPVEVAFHRPWEGERRVTGRLMSVGKPFVPSPALVARAWSPRPPYFPPEFKPEVKSDGSFQVVFDAENLALFFSDPEKRRGGFAAIGLEESSAAVDMVAMATYGGIVLDEDGKSLAGQTLSLYLKGAGTEPIATQQADPSGRFRFAAVPARVPLQLNIGGRETRPEYYLSGGDRLFEPGENRDKDEVRPRRIQDRATVARRAAPTTPLANRIEDACRNIRGSGMHALAIIRGDESTNVATLAARLLDDERSRDILKYLIVRIEPGEFKAEAAAIAKRGWPIPAAGQLSLVAMDGDQRTIATQAIAADPPAGALGLCDAFLKQHAPATRDARARLAAAREEARKTGRRVWVVLGGPRCGPCFRLGRWIDEHHATLDQDFVIVKVMGGLDEHADEVFHAMPMQDGDGIPWYAITEPDGTILTTSRGPLGNLGFPTTVEDLRHLRRMLERSARKLTAAQVDGLIGSLATKP